MGTIRSYRDLIAWQKALNLAQPVYSIARRLPVSERYGLRDQLCRAVVSIPSNIAEGHARGSRRDFVRFIRIAIGSLAELETQLEIVRRLDMVDEALLQEVEVRVAEVGKILTGLRVRLDRTLRVRS